MLKIKDSEILPPELTSIFQSLEYEENGTLSFRSITHFEDIVNFDFVLYLNDFEKQEIQNWRLKIVGYLESKIDIKNLGNYFYFYSDHYLLKEFNNRCTELYYKKPAKKLETLIAEIYSLHFNKFRNLLQLEKYLSGGLLETIKLGSGIFAKGPKYILDYYFEILKNCGCEPYFFGESDPIIWDGERWIQSDSEYKLVLLERTYFIGREFQFHRLEEK